MLITKRISRLAQENPLVKEQRKWW